MSCNRREEHTWILPSNCGGGVQTKCQGLGVLPYVIDGFKIMELWPRVRSLVSGRGQTSFSPLQSYLLGLQGLNLAQPENRLPFILQQHIIHTPYTHTSSPYFLLGFPTPPTIPPSPMSPSAPPQDGWASLCTVRESKTSRSVP